jgi:hypothetical protein
MDVMDMDRGAGDYQGFYSSKPMVALWDMLQQSEANGSVAFVSKLKMSKLQAKLKFRTSR